MRKQSKMTISGGTLAAVILFVLGQGTVMSAGGEGSNSAPAWVFETSTAIEVTQTAPASPHFRFTHLTVEDGLSDSAMSSVVQDQQGFMWFGTERGGLNRYDGYEFKVYQHDEDNERSLSLNRVTTLLLDSQGTLWIGTGAGLNRYNRDTDDFTCYRPVPGDETSLADILVSALCEDASGAIWVGTDKGVCRLDRKTGKFTRYRHDPENPRSLSSDFIRSVFADPQSGLLWVGTVDQGAGVLDPESGEFTAYRYDPNIPGSIGGSDVTCFLRDKAGVLWVGMGGGLNRFVPETKTFVHYRHDPEDPGSVSDNYVWALFEDRAGRFWVCTPRGLNLMDRSRGVFSRLLAAQGDPTSYCAASLNQVCEDNTGAVWATSHLHGVVRLPSVPEKFKVYCHNPENTNSLRHSMVQAIHIDRNNRAWIGTLAGLDYLDDCRPPVKHSILIDAHAVTEDKQGQIWAGAFPQGLFRIHGDNVTHYPHDPNNPNSPATDQIWALETDDLGGLWIIYWADGIGRFDGKTFTHYTADPADPQAVPASKSYGFAKDRDGFIWLAGEGGLTRFRPEDPGFKTYLIDPEHPEDEVNRSLLSVYIDRDRPGEMWVGTLFGLFRFDPVSGRFTRRYTKKDGLPSDNVQSIQRDNHGWLWLGTPAGLSCFDPEQGLFRNYDKSDGLPGNKFFIGAAAKAPDGQMFFGCTEGLASFYPDKMRINPNPPPVALTEFQLFNKPVSIGEKSPLQKAIDVADRIVLRYEQDVFRLRFAALDYTAPTKNRYAYKLEGFDKDWRYVGANDRSATYTRLSPGEYTFRVKASNNDGLWNEQGASIRIVVIPPWWQTWWFRSVAAGSLLALVYAGFGLRIRSMHKRNLQLEKQIAERKRAEKALQKNETLLNAAQRLSKVGGWEYDVKSGTSFWTEELYRIHEIPNDPGIDHVKESLACFRPEDRPMLNEAFQRACEQGESYDFELPFTTYTGKPLWIRTTAQPVIEEGKVVRLYGNLMDITARKRAQEATAQEQERLKFIFDSLPIGVSLNRTYADGNEVRMINDAHLSIAGITREQDNPETWKHINHPDNLDERDAFMYETDGGKINHFMEEKRYIQPDGKIVWVAFSRLRRALEDGGFEDLCTAVDITELKEVAERLRNAVARLNDAQRIAHLGNWQLDLETNELTWSDEIYRIFEMDKEEFGASYDAFLDAVHPDDRDMVNQAYTESLKNKMPYEIEHRLLMPDGRIKYVTEKCETYYDESGAPVRSVGTVHDITERKLAQERVAHLASIVEFSDDAIIGKALNGTILSWNRGAEQIYGYTAAEIVGHSISMLVPPDMTDELAEIIARLNRGERVEHHQTTRVRKDGTIIHVSLTISPIKDARGQIVGASAIARDITGRVRADAEIHRLADLQQAILSNAAYMVISVDVEGIITTFNPAAERSLGYTAEELVGKQTPSVFHDPDEVVERARIFSDELGVTVEPGFEVFVAKARRNLPNEYEWTYVRKDGHCFPVLLSVTALRDSQGNIDGFLGMAIDITERKQAEENVRQLNEELEQRVLDRTVRLEIANKELEAFAYSVSHDLRAPLRHIDGYVELLISRCRGDLSEQGLYYLDTVASAARRMGLLIDDLLQFSRTGRSEMRREKVDMNQTLQEVLSELKESYAGRSIEWIVEDLPPVMGDHSLLRQVWANILGNAIKYTRPRKAARIQIDAKEGGGEIVFRVVDNGVGFDMRYADKLFGVFQRLHSQEEFEGTGIGLATVHRIIARHGGRVWAEAGIDRGATFYFSLSQPNP